MEKGYKITTSNGEDAKPSPPAATYEQRSRNHAEDKRKLTTKIAEVQQKMQRIRLEKQKDDEKAGTQKKERKAHRHSSRPSSVTLSTSSLALIRPQRPPKQCRSAQTLNSKLGLS
jgi:hypothetical protein